MRGGSWVFVWKLKDYLYGHFESCLSTNGAWGQKLWKIFNSLWAANEPVEYIVREHQVAEIGNFELFVNAFCFPAFT